MDLSQVKLVVSDMDGTLLNAKHEVSDRFYTLFNQFKALGIQFVAASGRQYNSIIDKLHPIKDDIYVIAENGGFAMHQGKELLSTPLERDKLLYLLAILERIEGAHPVLCGKHNAYLKNTSDAFAKKLGEYYTAFTELTDWAHFDVDILKIAVFHFVGSEMHLYPHVKHLKHEYKVKVSGANWLDISHNKANKGYALQQIQALLGVGPEETLVFGDYNNDLEMLAAANHNFKTTSNNDFGVEVVLEKLIAAKQRLH